LLAPVVCLGFRRRGQVLLVPNKVTNIHNNANTCRPYNPGEVISTDDRISLESDDGQTAGSRR
jgi:hypothetical protein